MIDAVLREEWSHLVGYLCGKRRSRRLPRVGRLTGSPTIRAWLRTAARRRAIDALRRAKRVSAVLAADEIDQLPSTAGAGSDHTVVLKQNRVRCDEGHHIAAQLSPGDPTSGFKSDGLFVSQLGG